MCETECWNDHAHTWQLVTETSREETYQEATCDQIYGRECKNGNAAPKQMNFRNMQTLKTQRFYGALETVHLLSHLYPVAPVHYSPCIISMAILILIISVTVAAFAVLNQQLLVLSAPLIRIENCSQLCRTVRHTAPLYFSGTTRGHSRWKTADARSVVASS